MGDGYAEGLFAGIIAVGCYGICMLIHGALTTIGGRKKLDDIRVVLDSAEFMPERSYAGDAGADIRSTVDIDIHPGETELIDAGFSIAIPFGSVGKIYARSGIATKSGIRPANCVGIIDCEYRGKVRVPLHNDSRESFHVKRFDKIAQLVIERVELPGFLAVETLTSTDRGEGGFGSTGV